MKQALLFTLAATVAMAGSTGVYAGSDRDVVRDANKTVVRNTKFGTCVRTKWVDGNDACAPEPAPTPAPAPVERTVLKKRDTVVYFDFDKATLTDEAKAQLDRLAEVLRKAKDIKHADIVGYADPIGASDYNQKLSEKRAVAVKEYLASRGYLNTRVTKVRALGESKPVAQCEKGKASKEEISCLAPDRRVELEVQYYKTQVVQ